MAAFISLMVYVKPSNFYFDEKPQFIYLIKLQSLRYDKHQILLKKKKEYTKLYSNTIPYMT